MFLLDSVNPIYQILLNEFTNVSVWKFHLFFLYCSQERERADILDQYRSLSQEAERYETQTHHLESEGSNLKLELLTKDSEVRRMRDKLDQAEREIHEVWTLSCRSVFAVADPCILQSVTFSFLTTLCFSSISSCKASIWSWLYFGKSRSPLIF